MEEPCGGGEHGHGAARLLTRPLLGSTSLVPVRYLTPCQTVQVLVREARVTGLSGGFRS